MKRFLVGLLVPIFLLCAVGVQAQSMPSAASQSPVPHLVNFAGTASDLNNKPMTGVVGLTFALYKDQQGGAPLWLETQDAKLDRNGHYTVQLGASKSDGLPAELFTSGEAHWLGVQISGQDEQPRVLLLSVPYALKAADAETVGGLPASAFALATSVNGIHGATRGTFSVSGKASAGNPAPPADPLTLSKVAHDKTLKGNGTKASPLGITIPMDLTDSASAAAITGANKGSGAGVVGISAATQGVVGQNSNSFPAVEGANAGVGDGVLGFNQAATGFGVRGFSGTGSGLPSNPAGVIGDSKTQVGVVGLSLATAGVVGVSTNANGVQGSNPGTTVNTAGVYGTAGNASGLSGIAGVWGNSLNNVGTYGTSSNSAGVEGESVNANGVYGLANNVHAVGAFGQNGSPRVNGGSINFGAGVRGDGGTVGDIGVIGSSDDAPAGYFTSNIGAGGFGFSLISEVFDNSAGWPFIARNDKNDSSCNVDNVGNLNCTGAKHAVVPIDGGARRVALSAIESPKNWFEDFGSAQLAAGSTVVALDPDFAQTVNAALEYHVFLTPNGDCKGLYISNRTSASFEVRELGGGSSGVPFSYRIVALRKNYEDIRLEDHTNDPDPMKIMRKSRAGGPPLR
jgi:hypothetical protein